MRNIKKALLIAFFASVCCLGSLLAQQEPGATALSEQQKKLIAIAAQTAKGDLNNLKIELNKGLDAGLSILKIKECIIHAYAYCGFPRSIRGLQTFIEVLDDRKSRGVADVMGVAASPAKQNGSKYERGKAILDELVNAPQGRPQPGYAVFAPVVDTFLKEHLFADLFERNALTYSERELITISVLSAIGGAEPMLRSHLIICQNVGLSSEQLIDFIQTIHVVLGKNEADKAASVLNEVLGKTAIIIKPEEEGVMAFLPKGEKVNSPHFTGNVWLHMLHNTDTIYNINAGNVTFEPGARTHWHTHPGGQILLVTSGSGRYQEFGKPVMKIQKGDVIKCDPHVKHWHGAAPDSTMSHIAIGTNQNRGAVKWLEPVSEAEYRQ